MLKTGHLLMLEHAHHHVPVCAAEHDQHATHLHDERFNPDSCSVCAFLLAVPDLAPLTTALNPPQPLAGRKPTGIVFPHLCASAQAIRLRGPPVLCSITHC